MPKFKIGSSDFFFAVSKARPDLLDGLNAAMSRLQDENRYFNQQMSNKYITTSGANVFLSEAEKGWLSGRAAIRVGYEDDLLAFCAADAEGNLTGALKDYLDHAADCLANARLAFEPVAYPSAGAAMEALESGEVDCMFPACLSTADGESRSLVMTPAVMRTDLYAVVRKADRDAFSQDDQLTVVLPEGDPDYDSIVMDHFPDWERSYFADTQACLRAVSEGKADCVLISNYQYNSLSALLEQYGLAMLATGKDVEFTFAVNLGDKELYSILTRTTNLVSGTTINAALNYYASEAPRITLRSLIQANPAAVIAVLTGILALIAIVIFQQRLIVARKVADERQHRVEDLSRQVYVDALTRVRNKGGYDEYVGQLQSRIDRGESPAVAVAVFDCDNLKQINDRYGHDKGNLYLQAACRLICNTFQHSPVFRVGGDEFTAVLMDEDYRNREALARRFSQREDELRASAREPWEQVHVAMGLAVYDPRADGSLGDTMRRADKDMYENKRNWKRAQ